jgi:hypothetical protein
MKSKALLTLMVCGVAVTGCSQEPRRSEPLRPSVLNSDAAHFNNKTVVVRGYLTLAPEAHVLYESQELASEFSRQVEAGGRFDAKSYSIYCLTVANPEWLYENKAIVNNKVLVVQGRFIDNYLDGHTVDLGACPLPTAIVIDEMDLKRRYQPRK